MNQKPTYEELEQRVQELEGAVWELRREKEALEKQVAQYKVLIEASPFGIAIIDQNHRVVEANSRFAEMLGYTPEEVVTLHTWDWEAVMTEAEIHAAFADLTKTRTTFETRHRRKDGTIYDAEVTACGAQVGDEAMVLTITRDISDRKQVEKALVESEERYRKAVEHSNDGFAIVDRDRHLFVSGRLAAILGYESPDEIMGQPVSFLVHPDDKERVAGLIGKRLAGESVPTRYEFKGIRKDGTVIYLEASACKTTYRGKEVALAFLRDVSDRKQAEEALRESEEKYRRIYENSVVGFFQSTPEGRFLHVNPALAKMLRYDSPEDLVSSIHDIASSTYVDPADRRRYQEALQAKGYVEDFQFQARCKDGAEIWISDSSRAYFDKQGKLEFYEGIVVDITERKRAEEEKEKLQAQLAQAQKMESVGRLAGGVAHDFNNMLGVILGQTELGLLEAGAESPLRTRLEGIQKAAKRSADLTRQLLAFARKQTVSPKALDLNETVEGMLKMLRRLIGEDIDLAWVPGDDLWWVWIDPSQIDQILANLCVNARDAIGGVGKITIETQNVVFNEDDRVRHGYLTPGEFVMLAVSDDGCGMDDEIQSHLFEPFFTTKEVGKGTGLGLATVYGIVKQNNGFINVYSEPGQGATFKIYLPRHTVKTVGRSQGVEAVTAAAGSGTILLVEDDTALRETTTQVIERLGYTVIPAASPAEAIGLAREHRGEIDLLISDVVMPGMNGRDLAARLISIYPHIKPLFMSGYTANVIAHHGVLDRGVHFIQKPFSRRDLAAKIQEAMDRD